MFMLSIDINTRFWKYIIKSYLYCNNSFIIIVKKLELCIYETIVFICKLVVMEFIN